MEFSVMMGILMEGFALTAEIFLITLVGSLSLGVVVALARMSKFKPLAGWRNYTSPFCAARRLCCSSWPSCSGLTTCSA